MTRRALYVIVVLAAAVIGVLAGQQIRFVASIPNMAAMFAWLLAAAAWGLVVVIGVVGMVLLALHRLADGVGTLGVAGALAVGVLAGQATGSEWRYPVETSARVEVELAAPISETFSGIGICRTIDNGDLIDAVQASAIVRVGRDQMSLFLWLAQTEGVEHRIQLTGYHTEGRLAWYGTVPGTRLDVVTEGLRTVGSGAFTGLEAEERGEPLGGTGGPRLLDGTFSWNCQGSP